ncbi:MAG TPA: WYL domain-containing protein [Candidatus Phocaeicola caecigallinarum]|nr:WYL domain-containing protein [Candidatus Phocaeicola caecigallinarum]
MGSRTEGLQRLLVIINKLKGKKRYIPARELKRYIAEAMEMRGYSGKSGRTLERDIDDIQSLFGITIAYAKREQGYYIKEEDENIPERYGQLLQNFDLLNALEGDTNLSTYVLAEHHRPLPSECLPMLISAIKHTHPVVFRYILVRQGDKVEEKKVLPHYLKESNQRWYLLAYEGDVLKTFGVDRIRDLRICASETFKRNMDINVDELFRDCYGIWNQPDIPVEDIELKYDALDGKFLKSVPLHHSQQVLTDNADEFRIKVRLRITNDFVMELLSRSRSLEVIRPQHLRERVRKVYEEALKRNE